MSDGQKLPFSQQINRAAARTSDELTSQDGMQLPCTVTNVSGAIVEAESSVKTTLTIPKVNVPHFGGEWIRYPVQIGDKGYFMSADASLNETSGLGQGRANLVQPANLTPLVFMPIGNANWTPSPNPNYLVMYGKTGTKIQSTVNSECSIEFKDNGDILINTSGKLIINGQEYMLHKHKDVQTGSNNSGTVV